MRVHSFTKKSGYTAEEEEKIDNILTNYQEKLPKATAHQRVKLALLTGDRFKNELIKYSRPLLSKGVPALLVDLKADVYCDASKTKIVEEFLLDNLKSIQEKYTFVGDDKEQDPTVELWLLYFVA